METHPIRRRHLLGRAAASAAVLAAGPLGRLLQAAPAGASRPNIVFIMADDLARDELGCYGGKNVKTPNIDAFARQGLRFTHAFASCAMCVPIRASLYTGLYPVRHGACRNHAPTKAGLKCVGDYLKPLGYRVGLTGKRHFDNKAAIDKVPGFQPNCVALQADYPLDGIRDFMSAQADQPFCLFVCSINPHAPWTVGDASRFDPASLRLPPHIADTPKTRAAYAKYLAEVEVFDREVGDVLKTIDELKLADSTVVIVAGEQGPQFPRGKWTCYDWGLRSAFIARWPGHIKPGATTAAMIQYEDVLPTLVELAGGTPPAEVDGLSFASVLTGQKTEHRSHIFAVHNNVPEGRPYPIRAVRIARHKLILNLAPAGGYHEKHVMDIDREDYWKSWEQAAAAGDAKARQAIDLYVKRPGVELYDCDKDPWELTNLADKPGLAGLRADLEGRLRQWMAQQNDPGAALDVELPPARKGDKAKKAKKKQP